jgi:hypothetical protein
MPDCVPLLCVCLQMFRITNLCALFAVLTTVILIAPAHSTAISDTARTFSSASSSLCVGLNCHLHVPPYASTRIAFVPFVHALNNKLWIVSKRVWSGAKGGYAAGFRCGSNYLRHKVCAHSEGARVECETFLWHQMCASGAPPHPGPPTPTSTSEGSGKASAVLHPHKTISKGSTGGKSTNVPPSRQYIPCLHCKASKRTDKLNSLGYCTQCTDKGKMMQARRSIRNHFQPVTPVQDPSPMQVDESCSASANKCLPPTIFKAFQSEVIQPMHEKLSLLQALTEALTGLKVGDPGPAAVVDIPTTERFPASRDPAAQLAALCVRFGFHETDSKDAIICDLCSGTPQVATTKGSRGGTAGIKNGEIGTKISETGIQKHVNELVKAIKKHFLSERHKFCQNIRAENQSRAKEYHNTGIAVARQAYLTVKEAKSGLFFERLILNAHLLGVRVGCKNHSDGHFFAKFVESMHTVMVRGIAHFLRTPQPSTGQRPPFCIVADKMTALRRTGQMVGMLVLVDGSIKAVFAGCLPVVEGHTGMDIARNLLKALEPYDLTSEMWCEQFTGQAYDGQYFNLRAHEAVCETQNVSPSWVISMHDGGHVLELCMNDCRNVRSTGLVVDAALLAIIGRQYAHWYTHMAKRIGDIHLQYNYGKKYEELRLIAVELQVRLNAPETFCDTRFAQAERKVYKNFVLNWPIIHQHMFEEQVKLFAEVSEREARGLRNNTKELDERVNSLETRMNEHNNFLFIGLSMGLVDVLGIVKDLSLRYQSVNQLPWELHESTLHAHSIFMKCAQRLRAGEVPAEYFPFLTKDRVPSAPLAKYSWDEFQEGNMCGVPLILTPFTTVENALKGLRELVAALCTKIADRIHQRIIVVCPDQIKQMALCLDLRVLCGAVSPTFDGDDDDGADARGVEEVVALRTLYTWAQEEGKLDLGRFTSFWKEHLAVKERLRNLYKQDHFGHPTYGAWFNASGVVIMQYMFTTKSFYADPSQSVKLWLHLFNHCILKSRCEAVVEGMGCVLDKHADSQRHLKIEKYTMEAMIHWNGPAAHECENFLTLALNEHFEGDSSWGKHFYNQSNYNAVYPHGPVLHRLMTAKQHKSKFHWWDPPANSE